MGSRTDPTAPRIRMGTLVMTTALAFPLATAEEASHLDRLDDARQTVVTHANTFVSWIDGFFADPTYEAEDTDTRFSVEQNVSYSKFRHTEYLTDVSAKVRLPNLQRRLSLVLEGNPGEMDSEDRLTDAVEESVSNPTLALQLQSDADGRFNASFSFGARISESGLYAGPRVRYSHSLSDMWSARYSQRLRWYTDDGIESLTGIDFDGQLSDTLLVRQSLRAHWDESERATQGVEFTLSTRIAKRLRHDIAIVGSLVSEFTTRPRGEWQSSTLTFRYRRKLVRNWLYLDIAPFVAFEREFDWRADPGIGVALHIFFENDVVSPAPHHSR